jgi:hypothetical protein
MLLTTNVGLVRFLRHLGARDTENRECAFLDENNEPRSGWSENNSETRPNNPKNPTNDSSWAGLFNHGDSESLNSTAFLKAHDPSSNIEAVGGPKKPDQPDHSNDSAAFSADEEELVL